MTMRNEPFFFHNGRAARTISELLAIIEESPQDVFDEHVNKERNDFATWVEMSLHEEKLARKLRTTTDRIATLSLVRDWLRARPAAQNSHFLDKSHQKEFLWGLALGIIMGIILFRIVWVLR